MKRHVKQLEYTVYESKIAQLAKELGYFTNMPYDMLFNRFYWQEQISF